MRTGTDQTASVTLTISIPPTSLSPNGTKGWRRKAADRADQRASAFGIASSKFVGPGPKWDRVRVRIGWYAGRESWVPDCDNAIGSVKGALDGLADAGVYTNDRGIVGIDVHRAVDKVNPRVEITVQPVQPNQSAGGRGGEGE